MNFMFKGYDGRWAGREDVLASLITWQGSFINDDGRGLEPFLPYIHATTPMQNLAVEDGAACADSTTFECVGAVADSPNLVSAILIHDGYSAIAFIRGGHGLPLHPNGGDIVVTWDTGANKIFRF